MGLDAMIFFFWMLSFKPAFSLFSFTLFKRPFSFSLLSAITVVSFICISEVVDVSPGNLDSSLWLIQPSVSHDVLCIEIKETRWQYTALTYFFPSFEPVHCSTPGSTYCFLTCIQVSQEAGKMSGVPISLRIFQFVVIHTIKGFSIVNETEVDVFLEFSFSMIQWILAIYTA